MTGPTFLYTGTDLAPLLERLLSVHDSEVARLDAELERYTPSQRLAAEATPAFHAAFEYDKSGNIRPKPPEVMTDVAKALYARQDVWVKMRETELWLLECYRRPSARWRLTLADLDRLYPEKTSRETLVASRVKPSAPLPWHRRLALRLAGWFAPFLRPRLGPASGA